MKDYHRIYNLITVILFGCLLIFPMLQIIFHIFPDNNTTGENRALAEMPHLSLAKLDTFPTQYDHYVNDHFLCRNLFLDAYFNYSLLNHQSPIPDVIIGKDNFLFCGKQELELYQGGKNYFTDENMDMVIQELRHRQEFLKQEGISFYVFIAPTAMEIYPEYLPKYIQRTPCSATEKFLQKIKKQAPEIPCLYLKEALLQHKDSELLYLKNDNHWNARGAYYGANAIMQRLSQDFSSLPQNILGHFKFHSCTTTDGNLATWLSVGKLYKQTWKSPAYWITYRDSLHCQITEDTIQDFEPIPGFTFPESYEKQYRTTRKNAPDIVVIRDSYSNAIIPFMAPFFKNSLFIFDNWQYGANWDIIQKTHPDIVMLIIYEPHIRYIAQNLKLQ